VQHLQCCEVGEAALKPRSSNRGKASTAPTEPSAPAQVTTHIQLRQRSQPPHSSVRSNNQHPAPSGATTNTQLRQERQPTHSSVRSDNTHIPVRKHRAAPAGTGVSIHTSQLRQERQHAYPCAEAQGSASRHRSKHTHLPAPSGATTRISLCGSTGQRKQAQE
jgi:hypothetical protein